MITQEAQALLNKIFGNIRYFSPEQYGDVVEEKTDEANDWNGSYIIVKLTESTFGENVFLKAMYEEDSYGGEDYVTSIQFVQPKPKEVVVTDFVKIG